jgi:subtilisin family serine protease
MSSTAAATTQVRTETTFSSPDNKIASPNVEQQLSTLGEAQIIVVLARPTGLAAAMVATEPPAEVLNCFKLSQYSPWSMLARAAGHTARGGAALAAGAAAVAAAASPQPAPVKHYRNLNVLLGSVDREGLSTLVQQQQVMRITGAPQFSLIAPTRVAAARPPAGVTWGIERLKVPALWKQGLSGKSVRVAHLDTGVDGKHPALKGAIAAFAQFDDTGSRVEPDPAPFDSGQHGTHTAATIAGRAVQQKSVGVAPGAELASAMVIEGGNAVARVLGGIDWAIENQVRILSMSLGFPGFVTDFIPIIDLLRERNVLPAIAVGNEGPATSRSPGNYTNVISVGACDDADQVANFSSSQRFARTENPLVPDLLGPGVNVISAKPGGAFQSMSGSSMATPHIAGLAALLMEAAPGGSANAVEDAIYKSCILPSQVPPDRGNRGIPDAVAALKLLTGIQAGVGHRAPTRRAAAPRKRKPKGRKK